MEGRRETRTVPCSDIKPKDASDAEQPGRRMLADADSLANNKKRRADGYFAEMTGHA
jgi:hypothetical protein